MKHRILTEFRGYLGDVVRNKKTADRYFFAVKRLFDGVEFNALDELSRAEIEGLLTKTRTKNDFSAAKNGLKHLKSYDNGVNMPRTKFFKETAAVKRNFSARPPKVIEADTTHRKINALRDVKLKTAFRLMEKSGLRVSECAALQKRDISIDGDMIKIDVKHGKGGSNDVVTCIPDKWLSETLGKHLETMGDGDKPFYAAQTMKNKAGELGLECHDFRRLAANAYRDGRRDDGEPAADANEETKDFLRHSNFTTTKRYLTGGKLKITKKT